MSERRISEIIKEKQYVLENIRFTDRTELNNIKQDYQTRLLNEILILKEMEDDEMKQWLERQKIIIPKIEKAIRGSKE